MSSKYCIISNECITLHEKIIKMKKIFVILSVALLVSSCSDNEEKIVGVWNVDECDLECYTTEGSTMTFREDNTFVLGNSGIQGDYEIIGNEIHSSFVSGYWLTIDKVKKREAVLFTKDGACTIHLSK